MKIIVNGEAVEVGSGSSGTPIKPVTKAEYDALPEAEKQSDAVYVITDDNEGGSGGGSPEEIYSTEETRIGTWIDGKPLYRKVYAFDPYQEVASRVTFYRSVESLNIEELVDSYTVGESRGSNNAGIYTRILPNTASVVGLSSDKTNFCIYSADEMFIKWILLEYTKTTDTTPTQEVTQ